MYLISPLPALSLILPYRPHLMILQRLQFDRTIDPPPQHLLDLLCSHALHNLIIIKKGSQYPQLRQL